MNSTTKKLVWIGGSSLLLALLFWNENRTMPLQIGNYYYLTRAQIWLGAIGTLAAYSFLIHDNPVYQGFEHAFMGAALGLGITTTLRDVLVSQWWTPMATGFKMLISKGPSAEAMTGTLLVVPAIIGLLWYFQFSKRYVWLSRIPLCIGLGVGAGMGFKNIFNTLMPQITGTFKPLWVGETIVRDASTAERVAMSAENLIFVVGTISVISYFFFAFGKSKYGIRAPAKLGRWYLMLSLGAFFGNTFMSRLSALIERFQFLFSEWLRLTSI